MYGIIFAVCLAAIALILNRKLISPLVSSNEEILFTMPIVSGLSGHELAEKLLQSKKVKGVSIVRGEDERRNEYDTFDKRIVLSGRVFDVASVSSASIAAHEASHAVQSYEKTLATLICQNFSYYFFCLLVALVGVYLTIVSVFGVAVLAASMNYFMVATLSAFVLLKIFQVIHEFEASSLALRFLKRSEALNLDELARAKKLLFYYGSTYLLGVLGWISILVLYSSILILKGS